MAIVKSDADGRDRLAEEIAALESVTNTVKKEKLPEVTLDPVEYSAPTDADLAVSAQKKLADYKDEGISAIKAASEKNAKALADARLAYTENMSGELEALGSDYAAAAKSIDSDVIKRGLARSSIAANAKSELAGDYAGRAASVRADYGKKISDLDAEISAVGTKLQKALDDFNLSYAVKLNDTLAALKTERDKNVQSAVKYNNELKISQAKLDADRRKTENDLYDDAIRQQKAAASLDGLSVKERDEIYKSVYGKMDEFLGSLSKEQAKLEIRNHTLYRDHLSDYYFYRLYDKYGR